MFPVMIEVQELHSGTVGFVNFSTVCRVMWHEEGAAIHLQDMPNRPVMVRQSPTQLFAAVERKIAALQAIRKENHA